jgi:tRNA (guanine-N7-)-methyltransferase
MSFGLGHGRPLDDAPGVIGVTRAELPPLPDDLLARPESARVDPRRWFPHPERPFEIEIGSGKGGFLLQHALANPGTNFLGMEIAREFYLYCADRFRRRALPNVRMLHADASDFLRWRCPAGVARVIHLYFSDPWPKTKHHKNRVVHDRFLADAWRALEPGGELRVVTDHDDLWAWDRAHFDRWTGAAGAPPDDLRAALALPAVPFEERPFTPPEWAEEGVAVGTNYERKMCDGRPPHACVLVKRPA